MWAAAADSFTVSWLAKMKKKGIDGQAYIDRLDKITAKWEAKLKAEGYPWSKIN